MVLEQASISPLEFANTERDWRFFCQWTRLHGRQCLPASPQTLALFLFSQREHWGWAASRTAARRVGRVHEWADEANPCADQLVRRLLSGVARAKGRRTQPRTSPIRAQDAAAIVAQAPQRGAGAALLAERRARAALVLGRAGLVPLLQLTLVGRGDVHLGPDDLQVHLPQSGSGSAALPARRLRLASTGGPLCPVAAVQQLLDVLPEATTLLFAGGPSSTAGDGLGDSPQLSRASRSVASSLGTVARRAGLEQVWAKAQTPTPRVFLAGRSVVLVGLDERRAHAFAELVRDAGGVARTEPDVQAFLGLGLEPAAFAFAVVANRYRPAVTLQLAARGVEVVGLREATARLCQQADYVGAGLSEAQVERMVRFCNTDLLRQMRDRAYMLVGLALCRRHAELRALVGYHLQETKAGFYVTVPPTKSRRTSRMAPEVLFLERTGSPACPATALSHWLELLDECGRKGAHLPVFPAVHQGVPAGPLPAATKSMTGAMRRLVGTVETIVSAGYTLEGRSPQISTRSLRVGGIVTLAESGAEPAEIAKTSLHQSVEQLAVYLRFEDPFLHAHHLNV
jgi:integrase